MESTLRAPIFVNGNAHSTSIAAFARKVGKECLHGLLVVGGFSLLTAAVVSLNYLVFLP